MSTRMTEEEWTHTLEVFRACRPRRGRKAADDRLFLEAMHFFTVETVRWRALPERFGQWNSVWRRFDRLSKAGAAARWTRPERWRAELPPARPSSMIDDPTGSPKPMSNGSVWSSGPLVQGALTTCADGYMRSAPADYE
jgi:hypothetical protein